MMLADLSNLMGQNEVDLWGVADPNNSETKNLLKEHMRFYNDWIDQKKQGAMEYLVRHGRQKENPHLFLDGVQSVVCIAMNYGVLDSQPEVGPRISVYCHGPDYHLALERKLSSIVEKIKEVYPHHRFRIFVDKEPVLERFWAWRSGIGWLGKNSMLINRRRGSYLFLGGFMTTLPIESTLGATEHCGRCQKCIEVCPTQALGTAMTSNRSLDSNLCIAYQTLENRGEIPEEISAQMSGYIAGCDLCQKVCPWNDPVEINQNHIQVNGLVKMSLAELRSLTEEQYKAAIGGTAMSRVKYKMFRRNLESINQLSDS